VFGARGQRHHVRRTAAARGVRGMRVIGLGGGGEGDAPPADADAPGSVK
jgi:hypothetical protein